MVLVNFRTLQSKLYKIELPPNAKISQAKEEISKEIDGSDPSRMKMMYKSKLLNNDVPISSLHLGEKDFIVVNASQAKPKPAAPSQPEPAAQPLPAANPIPAEPAPQDVPEVKPLPVSPKSDPNDDHKFEDGIAKLVEIGFDPELSLRALRATDGNIDQAAELIITGEIKDEDDEAGDAGEISEDELEHEPRDSTTQQQHEDGPIASPEQAELPPSLNGLSQDQAAETLLLALPKDEQDAIRRLQSLGNFNLLEVIQVYHACDKNEELAANILLSNLF